MKSLPPSARARVSAASVRNIVERLVVEHAAGGITVRTKEELAALLDLISRRVYRSAVGFRWSPYHEEQLRKLADATCADGGLTAWNLRTNEPPGGHEHDSVFVRGPTYIQSGSRSLESEPHSFSRQNR